MTHVAIIRSRGRSQPRVDDLAEWDVAEVKWYDKSRGYGFLVLDDGSERFLHFSALQLCGIESSRLLPGVRVRFVDEPPKRPSGNRRVVRIKIA